MRRHDVTRFVSFFCLFACALLFLASTGAHAQDATLARAKALIDAKKGQEAFALLDPLEDSRAGDPDFDYLLGIAAIDSGHLTRGVFALERVIAVKPNFPEARAEIARAYFLMGENRAAREEFEAVKASNPPPAVVSNVNQFLDALQARESVRNVTGINGYLEFGYGYDTNANAATTAGAFAIPAFGGAVFTNSTTGQKTTAWFHTVGGGLSGRYRLDAEWALIGSATISERYNTHVDQFDTGYLAGDGGITWKRDNNEITGLLQTQESRVDNNAFRRANGGTLQWRYTLTPSSEASVYGQHSRQVYPGQRQRDTLRDVIGGAYAKSFDVAFAPTVFAGLYSGQEVETHDGFGNFGDRLSGLRLGGQLAITSSLIAFINGSYEDRRYRAPDPLFVDTRHDKQSDVRVGANWVVGKNFTLTPSAAWTDNRSNIVIYDYSRWITMLSLRYDFR
ncbi:MAG TPA: tetratricopeptide repeat protein [Burkholderiales bacterium]|jgi:tetratricopeptide (TPR) repeat protein|nr:tetratricopeptide repeat protein [Burkholderiales bacterium]